MGNEKCIERIVFIKGKYKNHLLYFLYYYFFPHFVFYQPVICCVNYFISLLMFGTEHAESFVRSSFLILGQ